MAALLSSLMTVRERRGRLKGRMRFYSFCRWTLLFLGGRGGGGPTEAGRLVSFDGDDLGDGSGAGVEVSFDDFSLGFAGDDEL